MTRMTAFLLALALAAPGDAQFVRTVPRAVSVLTIEPRRAALRPAPLSAAEQIAAIKAVTGNAAAQPSAAPLHVSVAHDPGAYALTLMNVRQIQPASDLAGMMGGGLVQIQIGPGGHVDGQYFVDCVVNGIDNDAMSWYIVDKMGHTIGADLPVVKYHAVFAVDMSNAGVGMFFLTAPRDWVFFSCDMTKVG